MLVVIDQHVQFTGIRAVDFFVPLLHHLQPADLLEQLRFLGLPFFLVLALGGPGE
jgi:hypothetical protein